MKNLWELMIIFFKVGLFTFGGGYAMFPLLKDEIVTRKKWATEEDLLDYYSIGQCTPGIIAINVSTFIGYKVAGKTGAIFATTAMVIPSIIIISLIASVLDMYMNNQYLSHAFAGIRIAVIALILNTVFDMWKRGISGKIGYSIFFGAMILIFYFQTSAVVIVLLAILIGLLLKRGKC